MKLDFYGRNCEKWLEIYVRNCEIRLEIYTRNCENIGGLVLWR